MSKLDILIERLGMGTVNKLMHEHYGTVLPKINSKGKIVGGNVLFFDVDSGRLLSCESLISYLYPWYCFDYYVDSDTFFGEHLISGKQIAIVPDEKTVLLGSLCYPSIDWLAVGTGCDLTDKMMNKFIGRRVVLFPDDFSSTYWHNHFGTMFRVDLSFVNQDINKYLIELIHRTAMA